MIFHENRLLADDSHEISYLVFVEKLRKMSQNLSPVAVAVVIGTLRVNFVFCAHILLYMVATSLIFKSVLVESYNILE